MEVDQWGFDGRNEVDLKWQELLLTSIVNRSSFLLMMEFPACCEAVDAGRCDEFWRCRGSEQWCLVRVAVKFRWLVVVRHRRVVASNGVLVLGEGSIIDFKFRSCY